MSAISRKRKMAPDEREVFKAFLPVLILFPIMAIGFGLVLPMVHLSNPAAGTITANELAGTLGLMCVALFSFVILLQNRILDLQRRVRELEKQAQV